MAQSGALTFHSVTDVGRGREQNEDSMGDVATAGGELLVVCDGMGGHENGEVASRIAVDAILQIFQNSPSSDPAERLKNGFLVANQRILAHAEKAGSDGMGTTAVAAFVKDGEAWVAHVGDSRCYHLRGESVLWRTLDHTRVQKMIDRGILTPEQAKTHEDANVVTRALGFARGEEQPEPDIAVGRELRDGDLLLLCSDGLFDLVKDEEIAELGSDDEPAEAAQRLVDLANRRGGHDNITVTLLRYGAAAKRAGGSRKTDLDEPGPAAGSSAMKTTDVAKSAAAAREIIAREKAKEAAAAKEAPADPQSKKALGLVIAGVALVGIAVAVFLLTRGGDDEPTKNPARDAGATSPNTGSGDPLDPDAGAGSAAAGSADGGTLTAPTWDTPDRPKTGGGGGSGKKGSGAGSGSAGAAAGSGAGSGSGSAAPSSGSGATGGSATPPNAGSGATAGSGGGGGFASKLGVGGGGASGGSGATAGSAATPKVPPGPPAVPTNPQTPPTTNPQKPPGTTTPAKPPATTTPAKPPATQPAKPPATTPGVSPPGMTPSTGSGTK